MSLDTAASPFAIGPTPSMGGASSAMVTATTQRGHSGGLSERGEPVDYSDCMSETGSVEVDDLTRRVRIRWAGDGSSAHPLC